MKEQWIVGICNTNGDGVDLIGFYGTEDEMKAALVEMIQSGRTDDEEDDYEYGTESVEGVDVRHGGTELYAYSCHYDYHIDYSAMRLSDILKG